MLNQKYPYIHTYIHKYIEYTYIYVGISRVNNYILDSVFYYIHLPGNDVMIFKNIFAEKFSEKIGVFDSKQS
jgi:hypothetical protein